MNTISNSSKSLKAVQTIFPRRHPYLASTLLFIATLGVFFLSGAVVTVLELPVMTLYGLAFGILGLLCAALLTQAHWWREIGFREPYERGLLWLFWLPFVPVLGNLLGGLTVTDPVQILMFAGIALLSGLVEETIFRGLILRALLPTGIYRAALISAVCFGAMHILNVLSISSPAYALLQVGYATAIGFGYAALVIRTGTIWPLMVAHALTNFIGFLAAGGAGSTGPVEMREMIFAAVYMVLFSGYGYILLRSHRAKMIRLSESTH